MATIMDNPFADIYKMCNTGSNKEKYKLIKDGIVSLPRYLDIELTNICNFQCRFCPTGTKSTNRMKGYMPDSVVDAIAENVRKYHIPGVRFIMWGEPTLHPKYIDIMKIIKNAGAKIHINTNGSLLDDVQVRELLKIPVDSIKFSFQGADDKTYNEMRKGGDYQSLIKKVRMVREMRDEYASPTYIQISTTLTTESAEQVKNFQHDVENACDFYNIGHTLLNHLNVENMNIDEEEKKKIKALHEQETIRHKYQEVCAEAFDKLCVYWNGDVTLCCSDYDNFMIVGNILDMDVQEIFTSRAADSYRKVIADKQYGRIKCCSTCYEIVPLTK